MVIKNKKTIICVFGVSLMIFLIGIISAATNDDTNTEFTLASEIHACVFSSDGNTAFWQWWDGELNKNEIGIPIPPKYSCYSAGGWPSDGCCPNELQCDVLEVPEPTCSLVAPTFCSDYNDWDDAEIYCKAFNINVAIRSIEERTGIEGICSGFYSTPIEISGEMCDQFTSNCRCYWDPDDDGGKCKSTSTSYVFCDGILDSEGNCLYETTTKIDSCDETGLLTYVWDSNWTNIDGTSGDETTRPSWCKAGTRVIDCSTLNLIVFTFWNVVFVILILIIIYYFIVKGRKNENKKRKSKVS